MEIQSKSVFDSKRAWGAVMLGIPLIIQLLGVQLTPDQGAQVNAALQHAQSAFADLMMAIGTVQMVYGAWVAKEPLHLLDAYKVDSVTGKKIETVKPIPLTPDVAIIMDEHPPK